MYEERIVLTIQDILEKEFKIDPRGYRMQEVDKFLDIVIKDYNEYNKMLKAYEKERQNLVKENQELKQEIRNLKDSIAAAKGIEKEVTNVDLLRRISQLEKITIDKRCMNNIEESPRSHYPVMVVVFVLREKIT